MLEQVKMEFSQLTEESIACQRQRDEYQHKCKASCLLTADLALSDGRERAWRLPHAVNAS